MFITVMLASAIIMYIVLFATYWPQSNYNHGALFAISLPKDAVKHRDVEAARARFRQQMIRVSVVLLIIFLPMFFIGMTFQIIFFLVWTFASLFALVVPFRRAHRDVLALKRKHRWFVSDSDREDEYWGNGITYHNPNDSRVFVQKRIGIGMSVNTGTPAGKWFIGATIAITAAILIGVSFLLIRSEYTMPALQIVEEREIDIDYPMYSYRFAAKDIQEVTLLQEVPRGRRINGEATDKYARGHFNLDTIGRSRLYIVKNNPPYIHIRLADANIFYNEADPDLTVKVFEQLVQLQKHQQAK